MSMREFVDRLLKQQPAWNVNLNDFRLLPAMGLRGWSEGGAEERDAWRFDDFGQELEVQIGLEEPVRSRWPNPVTPQKQFRPGSCRHRAQILGQRILMIGAGLRAHLSIIPYQSFSLQHGQN